MSSLLIWSFKNEEWVVVTLLSRTLLVNVISYYLLGINADYVWNGMFLNFTSKNSKNEWIIRLKNIDFSNCRLKTQTTEKVRLDSNRWSYPADEPLVLKDWSELCAQDRLFITNFDAKIKNKTPVTKEARTVGSTEFRTPICTSLKKNYLV
jgi:hypothetical protein